MDSNPSYRRKRVSRRVVASAPAGFPRSARRVSPTCSRPGRTGASRGRGRGACRSPPLSARDASPPTRTRSSATRRSSPAWRICSAARVPTPGGGDRRKQRPERPEPETSFSRTGTMRSASPGSSPRGCPAPPVAAPTSSPRRIRSSMSGSNRESRIWPCSAGRICRGQRTSTSKGTTSTGAGSTPRFSCPSPTAKRPRTARS